MSHPAVPPQTPHTLLEGAHSYARAVEILLRVPTDAPLEALGLVAAHSVELALKSALLAAGRTEQQLRAPDLRHNLGALWQMALENGVPLDDDVPFWCSVLAIAHDSPYMFRYAREGWGVAVPQPADLAGGLNDLLKRVDGFVGVPAA